MAIEERLKSIPRSYNDFVKYVIARIEEDENVGDTPRIKFKRCFESNL